MVRARAFRIRRRNLSRPEQFPVHGQEGRLADEVVEFPVARRREERWIGKGAAVAGIGEGAVVEKTDLGRRALREGRRGRNLLQATEVVEVPALVGHPPHHGEAVGRQEVERAADDHRRLGGILLGLVDRGMELAP